MAVPQSSLLVGATAAELKSIMYAAPSVCALLICVCVWVCV